MTWYLGVRESCGEGHKNNRFRRSKEVEEGVGGASPMITCVRMTSVQQLSKEAAIWKKSGHRNLLLLYGVSASIIIANGQPCLVSQ